MRKNAGRGRGENLGGFGEEILEHGPDFYLPSEEEFVEIKGYMDDFSRYKIEECSKRYGIKIRVLHKVDLQRLGIDI